MDTLVLNMDGNPISIVPLSSVPWKEAIRLVFLEKVRVVKTYDDWVVHSPSRTIEVPSVVMTKEYVNFKRFANYSRDSILLRDDFRCQLCGSTPKVSELTLDHVIPKKHGGDTSWENIVAACKKCNSHKGSNKNIRPKVQPSKPTYYDLLRKRKQHPIHVKDESWADYLSWPPHLIHIQGKGNR